MQASDNALHLHATVIRKAHPNRRRNLSSLELYRTAVANTFHSDATNMLEAHVCLEQAPSLPIRKKIATSFDFEVQEDEYNPTCGKRARGCGRADEP